MFNLLDLILSHLHNTDIQSLKRTNSNLNFNNNNREEGCTTDAMDGAVRWGYLDVIIWLHENRNEVV